MEIGVWTQERIWSTHVSPHMSPVICWQAAPCFPSILWLSANARSLKKNMQDSMIGEGSRHVCGGTSLIYHEIVCLVFPLAWYFLIRRSSERCAVLYFIFVKNRKNLARCVTNERAGKARARGWSWLFRFRSGFVVVTTVIRVNTDDVIIHL